MPTVLHSIAAAALGLVFGWSGVAKLTRFGTWRSVLEGYRLPASAPLAMAVPLVELVVPALVVVGESRAAAALALTALASFSAAIVRARAMKGDRLPCGCFGDADERDFRWLLARNAALGLLAGAVIAKGRDLELLEGLGAPTGSDVVPVVLVVAGISVIVWLFKAASGSFSADERGGR